MDYTCKNCGNVFESTLNVCPSCGASVETQASADSVKAEDVNAQQQPYQQQPYQQQAYQQPGYQQPGYQQQAYQQPPFQQQAYPQPPFQQPYQQPVYQMGAQQKSKLIAGLLGVFLGGWGIHNFYLGFTNKAIIQIVVSICTCGVGALWGFIEGILILVGSINTDANGIPLGE